MTGTSQGGAAMPVSRTTVLLIRHGETTWNSEKRFQGQQDPPLTKRGVRQASLLAARLADLHIDLCLTSDLTRAVQTAEALCAGRAGLAPKADSALREVGMGTWECHTQAEVAAAHPEIWDRWRTRPDWDLPPAGEGADSMQQRARRLLYDLAELPDGTVAAVVSHGGFLQTVLNEVVTGSSRGHHPFELGNTSITTLRLGQMWWISGVNDTHHLTADLQTASNPAT